jgi:hypothetical protein
MWGVNWCVTYATGTAKPTTQRISGHLEPTHLVRHKYEPTLPKNHQILGVASAPVLAEKMGE